MKNYFKMIKNQDKHGMSSASIKILHRAKPIVLSLAIFTLLLVTVSFASFVYLLEPGPKGRISYLVTTGKLLLYKYSLVDSLTPQESKRLYKSTCTRKCHSKDVIEGKPRAAQEWEWIVARMGVPERANLSDSETEAITKYLQKNFLSNVPTTMPDNIMRFLKKNLWKIDFGDNDIYFDIIYLPRIHRSLVSFLTLTGKPVSGDETVFVIYLNTHSGTVPRWDLSKIIKLEDSKGQELTPSKWTLLYEDSWEHHRQGILTFPTISKESLRSGTMKITVFPPGMKNREYTWNLPIPDPGKLPGSIGNNGGNL